MKNPDDLVMKYQEQSHKNDYFPTMCPNCQFQNREGDYELRDYLIIDRHEHPWPPKYHKRIIKLKTYAPLSGHVVLDESLNLFPLNIHG